MALVSGLKRIRFDTVQFGGKTGCDSGCGLRIGGLAIPPFLAGAAGLARDLAAGPLPLRTPRRVLQHPVQGAPQMRGRQQQPFLFPLHRAQAVAEVGPQGRPARLPGPRGELPLAVIGK